MAQEIRGIIFDLGDTLLDFGSMDISAEFEKGTRLAYDRLKEWGKDLPSFASYHRRQFLTIRWQYFLTHVHGRDFNALDLLGRLGRRFGHDLTREETVELAGLWYEPVRCRATTEPGLREMLVGLRDDGLKLGLLSNTFIPPEILDRHIEQENLIDLLPVRVYSCDLPRRKPHRSAFTAVAEKIGLPLEELMFVGDSLKADIHGANRVGMVSVLKDPSGKKRHRRITPDHHIRSMLELPNVLRLYDV
jgi:FMN phosphatase YigB (HAD superfamily)